jgi:hypothetical protein
MNAHRQENLNSRDHLGRYILKWVPRDTGGEFVEWVQLAQDRMIRYSGLQYTA